MMHFCTLFDSNYASKGIALYLSIERFTEDFVLYIMAMDKECFRILESCHFRHAVIECIDDVNSRELDEARANRSRAEFCWTCGSFFTAYFLDKYNPEEITYLDSDLMFFSSPAVLYHELEAKEASVGISPHFSANTIFGKYCVQFVYFANDDNGRSALGWWRNECLKWCYSKLEDGKYGDQKYLDSFADMFNGVVEIENRGAGIAYWNMSDYAIHDGCVHFKGSAWPFVFFHYSGFVFSVDDGNMTVRHSMYLPKPVIDSLVLPYINLLTEVYQKYLGSPVVSYMIKPANPINYAMKTALFYLSRALPVKWIEGCYLRTKYRDRKPPYSER